MELNEHEPGEHEEAEHGHESDGRHKELVQREEAGDAGYVGHQDAQPCAQPESPHGLSQEAQVEDVGIDSGEPDVKNHVAVVAVVGVSHAAASEPAVVVALQDAGLAGRTVVGPGREVVNARGAVPPRILLLAVKLGIVPGGLGLDQQEQTHHPVHVHEKRCATVHPGHARAVWVIIGEHMAGLVPQGQVASHYECAKGPLVIAAACKYRV